MSDPSLLVLDALSFYIFRSQWKCFLKCIQCNQSQCCWSWIKTLLRPGCCLRPSYHQLHLPSTHWRLHRWLRRRINSVKESEFILFYSCCAKSMAEMTNLPFPPIIRLCFIRYDFTSGWPQKSNTNLNYIQNKEEESACLNMNKIVLTLSEA